MKVRIPKEYSTLSTAQRQRIEEYCRNVATTAARETTERDGRIMLDLYIKMVCLTLHDCFGFGEKRLTLFLGNHRALFFSQEKMVKNGSQLDYLNDKMAKIFKKRGFPQRFFDKILGPVEAEEVSQE